MGVQTDRIKFGICLVVAAVFMMSVQDATIKHFSTRFSVWQIFTLRGVFAVGLVAIVTGMQGNLRQVGQGALQKWVLIRSAAMTLMLVALYTSIPFMDLSVLAAGFYTGPIFTTLITAYLVKEAVTPRGWVAVTLGFCGVLVILQPGSDSFNYLMLVPVFGGFLFGVAAVIARTKCIAVPALAMSFSLTVMLLITGVVFSAALMVWHPSAQTLADYTFLIGGWQAVDTAGWALLLGLSVLVLAIQIALAGAYQSAPSPIIATFDYSYLIFVAVWDVMFFDTTPSASTIIGVMLIISAGIITSTRS